jgi:hypothetical protein
MTFSKAALTLCRPAVMPCLAAALLLGSAASTHAAATLREGLATVAKDISQLLAAEKLGKKVGFGQFTGPPTRATSSGPGIAQMLAEELQRLGITIETPADVGIEGKYRAVQIKETGEIAVQIIISLVDAEGKSLGKQDYQFGIFGEAEMAAALGLTVHYPPKGDNEVRNEKVKEAYNKPSVSISRGRIAAGQGSPYALMVLVSDTPDGKFRPRKPKVKNGAAYVDIKRGEYYRLVLINDSAYEAAARVTIDGISMYAFSNIRAQSGQPKYGLVVIGKGKAAHIKGWHIDNEQSDSFVVTEYAKTAAAELKSKAKMGTITVSFMAAWGKNEQPPADEPSKPSPRSAGGDGTGRGARVGAKYKEVSRNIGVVRASVSVRYTK